MHQLTASDARLLSRVANGRVVDDAGRCAEALVNLDLLRAVPPEAAELSRHHRALRQSAEDLRLDARRVEFPGGLGAVRLGLVPGARRRAQKQARSMRDRADSLTDQAKEQWLALSQHNLVDLDLDLCAACADGSFLSITDAGREALRVFLQSDPFEASEAFTDALAARLELFLRMRAELLASGYPRDPRVDLAVAIASRFCDTPDRLRELNRLTAIQRWANFDRLPIVAMLCRFEGQTQSVWKRFWAGYELLRERGLPGGYETRLLLVNLMAWTGADDESAQRQWEVARRLRIDGWSLSQSTDPVAARLAGLRLSPTQIATRVQQLYREMERPEFMAGPFLALASSVAADTNLHPLALRAETADVMAQSSVYTAFVQRYEVVLRGLLPPGSQASPTFQVIAALLAVAPGTIAGNLQRVRSAAQTLAPHTGTVSAGPLACVLMDAACPDWFDASRFVWEIGCCLQVPEPTSVFTAFAAMSPMFQRAASAAEPGKPDTGMAAP